MIVINKYWKKRNSELLSIQLKKADTWYKDLTNSYLESLKRIESELESFYSTMDRITLKEARKHLTGADLQGFKRNIKYYLTDELRDEWRKELIKYKDRTNVPRLQSLQVKLRHELEVLGYKEESGLDKLSLDISSDMYYKELFEVTKTLGFTKTFNTLDVRKIELLNKTGWADDGLNFSERIWGRQEKVNNFLNKELVQSISLGEDPQVVINKMAKTFNTNRKNAGRLIMTEAAYYTSESQNIAYEELGVKQFQYIATLDDRTSDICQEMDLKVFNMRDYETGVTVPPLHPYCRSTTIPYFSDNQVERITRDDSGEWVKVPDNIEYKEWFEKYVK